jgi:hypothetical protein
MNTLTDNNTGSSAIAAIDPATAAAPASPPAIAGKAKLTVGFINRNNDKDLLTAASRILTAMTGNPAYAAPSPTLAALTAARDALLAVVNNADDSSLARATRRQLRPPLALLLRQLAQYVQPISQGDPVVLMSSGFPLQRTPQPAGVLPAPANLRLSRGKLTGQLRARCNVVARAASYQWRIASAQAPTAWLPADPSSSAHATLSGLTAGTSYVVQVRAIGSQGPGDWSDAATQIAM